ncbi:MAG: MvaI/BcnI family restriction endonuclease [Hyphomonas sp.]|nr:MvaI/BcnI family restriction endonuclease [Hyphomonas sp.]
MRIESLQQLKDLFRAAGVRTLYVKKLAPVQDNEKNQIVLGQEVAELAALFPAKLSLRAPSQSELKRKSDVGRPITEATLNFFWMNADGARFHAPGARLIDYFQYPEARLSGFLQGCKWAPRAIRRDEQAAYGQRILVMGSNAAGEVTALLLTQKDDPVVTGFPKLEPSGVSNVLSVLSVASVSIETPGEMLAARLRRIIAEGWHPSTRNKGGTLVPFTGNQGGGYTLEALLGVETNALKEPDILGFEVKSYQGSKLSLMTPTADGGPEGDLPFRGFMETYGEPARSGDGSLRYTGVVRAGRTSANRGLTLRVTGYDDAVDRFSTEPGEIRVEIFSPASGEVISSWSLEKLAEGWNAKHASAVYVRVEKRENPETGRDEYRYLAPFMMCEGTDIWRLLRAIHEGVVYYDPAHSIYADDRAKQRPQWRVSTVGFGETLGRLYRSVRAAS